MIRMKLIYLVLGLFVITTSLSVYSAFGHDRDCSKSAKTYLHVFTQEVEGENKKKIRNGAVDDILDEMDENDCIDNKQFQTLRDAADILIDLF